MTDELSAERVRAVATQLDSVPSVARRSSGILGVGAAYLPGERIDGIRLLEDGHIEVHVVMRWGSTVDQVERDVLGAVRGSLPDERRVDVVIDDIALPDGGARTS